MTKRTQIHLHSDRFGRAVKLAFIGLMQVHVHWAAPPALVFFIKRHILAAGWRKTSLISVLYVTLEVFTWVWATSGRGMRRSSRHQALASISTALSAYMAPWSVTLWGSTSRGADSSFYIEMVGDIRARIRRVCNFAWSKSFIWNKN